MHGPDFPGETFEVLKEKDGRLYGDASAGQGDGVGGVAHTESVTHTSGVSHGVGVVEGAAHTEGAAQTNGTADTVDSAQSHGVVASTSATVGHSSGWSLAHGASLTQAANAGGSVGAEPLGVGARVNLGGHVVPRAE